MIIIVHQTETDWQHTEMSTLRNRNKKYQHIYVYILITLTGQLALMVLVSANGSFNVSGKKNTSRFMQKNPKQTKINTYQT